jgi:hypothetical protein
LRGDVSYWGPNTSDYQYIDGSNHRFYIDGNEEMRLTTTGLLVEDDIVAYSSTLSDERLKDNVVELENALDKVTKLRGVEYDWNAGSRKGQHDIGFIAQEVEKILPEIVREKQWMDDNIYKTVDYEKVVAVLVEAIKELKVEINKLKNK